MDDQVKRSRTELDREARKADIINTAARLFSEQGFHDVKMDDIAERVGLSKGTIYLYFANKESLFLSIIQVGLLELTTRMQEVLRADAPFPDLLRQFVLTSLQFLQKHEAFFRIMHSEKMKTSADTHYQMHECGADAHRAISRITDELMRLGQRERVLRGDAPEKLSKALLGILEAHLYHRVLHGGAGRIEEDVEEVIDYFLNGAKARAM